MQQIESVVSVKFIKAPLTDLFKPLLKKTYSYITLSFLVILELIHVFKVFHVQ